ncbi:sensor histidine kinase [Pseudoalteromonas simplex]|uniref:sensor histidine kinase n=1 Tax=Pseudoalteromonas simplex TaxID=2783613 RepID=UPI001886AC8E|nr:sensor histidine kinase [Pseudoalteromonas sp. A520]
MTTLTKSIRPAARLLRTIGQDLVKDSYAAIVELVKNAYDADSPDASIKFNYDNEKANLIIEVIDQGHGMSLDTIVNKWLVPATDDKLLRKKSSKNRALQGRKGIGRFAASILGDIIILSSVQDGKKTYLKLDMKKLAEVEFLDQFKLEVKETDTDKKNGTSIKVIKKNVTEKVVNDIWNDKQIQKLLTELRNLLSPEEVYKAAEQQGYEISHDSFSMTLEFLNFPNPRYASRTINLKPFPILSVYDYKISGKISSKGNATLYFENQNLPNLGLEKIEVNIPISRKENQNRPGEIFIDLRVYDRDPSNIDNIIKRGLKDPDTGEFVGKQDARKILDETYGVGLYREQFRIRPYGDPSFDWLDLDKRRVQQSNKVGHNQIIGLVYIRSEESSGLEEKSARDGLVENNYYFGLIHSVKVVLNELEARRSQYRRLTSKYFKTGAVDAELEELFDFSSIKKRISTQLLKHGLSHGNLLTVEKVVSKELESDSEKKSEYLRKIKETIATYQGQASLGKITHVLLHEGRKHIKYISETVPRITSWAHKLGQEHDNILEEKLRKRSQSVKEHTKGLTKLFKRIEPLARVRKGSVKSYNLVDQVSECFDIFQSELKSENIVYKINSPSNDIEIKGYDFDIMTVFSNLLENSIYWLKDQDEKLISVDIYQEHNKVFVEFIDNGPGFEGNNLELIFEPNYSMRPDQKGTGLGLALAGESMKRMGGSISAQSLERGACFELTFNLEE